MTNHLLQQDTLFANNTLPSEIISYFLSYLFNAVLSEEQMSINML